MTIKKMLLVASMALTTIALMAPVAQANVQLTDATGNSLLPGDKVAATSTENFITTLVPPNPLPRIECHLVTLHLEVIKNGLNHVELTQLGTATAEGCALNRHGIANPATLPMTFTDFTIGHAEGNILTIDTWGQGTTNARLVSDVYAPGTSPPHLTLVQSCDIEGEVHVDVTHPSPSDQLLLTPSTLAGAGAGCPPEPVYEGEFTLETSTGGQVKVDFAETT